MTSTGKVALVTGANRGLGLEVSRQLLEEGFRVIAASRDAEAGKRALAVGAPAGTLFSVEPLDVGDDASVKALGERLTAQGERLDVLVNNAGMSMKGFNEAVAEGTTNVNFRGALRVTDTLLPLLKDGARVVMVSSGMGSLHNVSDTLKRRFLDPALDRTALLALVAEFVTSVREGRHEAAGWPSSAYSVSKIAMNALTRILARELAPRDIAVNSVCPGWVRTDMGGEHASRDVKTGGKSITWAALLPPEGESGGFFRDGAKIEW